MKGKDKAIGREVDVSDRDCPTLKCYWPRPHPGIFVHGQSYRNRDGKIEWICRNCAIHGYPTEKVRKVEKEKIGVLFEIPFKQ